MAHKGHLLKTRFRIAGSDEHPDFALLLEMTAVPKVLSVLFFVTLLASCEKWSWPPYQSSLRDLFAENGERFEEIRNNMVADELELMTAAHARGRGFRCGGADCPRTIDEHDQLLQQKYSALVEDRSSFQYTLRDGEFRVGGGPFPPTQGGDFVFDFRWSAKSPLVPHCDEGKARLPSCGACYEDLDAGWYMYWMWFPRDLGPEWNGDVGAGLPSIEEIKEQRETAVIECMEAGRIEMGLASGSE